VSSSLKFNPNNHQYRLDGKPVRGVTSLIKQGTSSDALIRWAGNTVADFVVDDLARFDFMREHLTTETLRQELRNVPNATRDKAGVRGTEIHKYAVPFLEGEEIEVPERIAPFIEAYGDFLDRWQVVPLLSEVAVANRHWWYAGTADLFATVGAVDDYAWCIDLKTGKWAIGDTALQTAAYARAEFYVDTLGEEKPLPPVKRHGLAHITEHGVDFYDLGDVDVAFQEFISVQNTAKTAGRRKKLTEAPLDPPDLTPVLEESLAQREESK
jgi:hypothetical protein